MSKQEENHLYELQAGDLGYGSLLNEEHEYEDIALSREKAKGKSCILAERRFRL